MASGIKELYVAQPDTPHFRPQKTQFDPKL
jgi:hypothetical protein